jgi:hypothetical protein
MIFLYGKKIGFESLEDLRIRVYGLGFEEKFLHD